MAKIIPVCISKPFGEKHPHFPRYQRRPKPVFDIRQASSRQSTSPSTRKTVPDPPRPPHPITSKPIFHQALPHQSISKRKLAIIEPVDLDFADNNFIIPVGKIAFVEDVFVSFIS
ncbi:hypothetical protein KEM48_014033 [Puccinia striiformis f. sp. tritici PST-130]|nr:hypothetical protein KEM48_014033 [Puccinia striiformis f. sp. tritici PST-130]